LTPREKLRALLKTDKMALAHALGYDFQEDVHKDLFDTYVKFDPSKPYFEQDPQKHRLILWSRAFYKTTSTIVEMVQTILNFPDVSLMIMQSTVPKSKELLAQVRGHFDGTNLNSKLRDFFPEFCRDRMGNAMAFTVPNRVRSRKDPTVFVASPRSSKAGLHPDAGFFDDLVTEQNYRNPELLKNTIEAFSHYTPLINNGGYFYVTGTRYAFGDLYEHIIRTNTAGRWKITVKGCWPEDAHGNRAGESNFPPRKLTKGPRAGESIGISTDELLAIQRDNPETFAAQYLNRPIAAGRQTFTEPLLLGAVIPKDTTAAIGPCVLLVDLASGRNADSDKSVVLCGRQINGAPAVTDLRSGQWTTLQIAQSILEMALLHRPAKVLVEGAAGSTYFIDYVNMIAKDKGIALFVEPLKVSNQKDAKYLRISAVEGAIKTGRLKFMANLPGWNDLVQQFVEFPRGRHDDEIDTVSMLVQFYSNQISNFEPINPRLPFFLQRPGIDYGLETKIVQSPADTYELAFAPEPIF
jgi:predicted phage terminase large subunit-like protein